MTIPSRLTVELDEQDVKSDIVKIIDSMSKIRLESLKNSQLSDEQKDEYLHLTYRLTSGIAGLSDQKLIERMEYIIKSMEKDPRLLHYDYMQDNYWKRDNQKFNRTLDKVVISVLGDNLHTLEDKHHVLQAIKFLGVTESPFEEKERIYGTILPFNGRVKNPRKRNKLSDLIGKIFGYSYRIEEDTEFNIKVNDIDPEFLEDIIREVQDYGYKALETVMTKADFDRLKIPNAQITDAPNGNINNGSLQEIVRKSIRYTLPLSYPLLGSLSGSLQNKIEEYTNFDDKKGFNANHACSTSCTVELVSGAIAFFSGLSYNNYLLSCGGAYLVIESLQRLLRSYSPDRRCIGFLPLIIATSPFLLHYGTKDGIGNDKKNINVKVKIQLNEREKIYDKTQDDNANMFNYFANIARNIAAPENIENNLVWTTQNHNNYGKNFSSYLYKTVQDLSQRQDCQQVIDKKNQFYNLFTTKQIGDYTKLTILAFSKEERYVLSLISAKQIQNPVITANEILASNKQTLEKAQELTERLGSEYTHLSRFVKGDIANNFEIIS